MPRSYHGIKSVKKVYARDRERGETPRFCLLLYLDLMQTQHFVHLAVQDNDFEMRIRSWKFYLPLYFALQKTNCARYGSYYVKVMENIEKMYPGLNDLLEKNGMSVQAQDHSLLELKLTRAESKRSTEMPRHREESSHLPQIVQLF